MSESHAVRRSIAVVAISVAGCWTGHECGPAAQARCEPPPEPDAPPDLPGPVLPCWVLAAAYDTITSWPLRIQVPWK